MCDSRAAVNQIVVPTKGSFPVINCDRQVSASISCALLWGDSGSFMTTWTLFLVGHQLSMCYFFLFFFFLQVRKEYLLLELVFLSSLAKGCFINSLLTSVSCHFLLLFHLKEDSGHVIIIFFSNCHKDAECFLIRSGSVHGET